MNTQTTVPPVRKTVTVKQPPEQAFAVFTDRIHQWWPRERPAAAGMGSVGGTVVLEPRPQGHVYRRSDDGSIEVWGEVTVWEPPHRLVLAWRPAPGGPAATEVEVKFTPEAGGTRVDLEHRGWDRLPGADAATRSEYESGWDDVLRLYAAASRDNGAAIASLILGITGLVLPVLGLLAAPFAIVLGVVGRRRAREGAGRGGVATAGLTLGAIALVLWSVLLVGGAAVVMVGVESGAEEQSPVPVETVQPMP